MQHIISALRLKSLANMAVLFDMIAATMHSTSFSLLDRLQTAADAGAWRRLTGLYSPLITGWLRRNGIRPDDADDLVQEVLAVVVRRLPDFEHNRRPGAFRNWLRTICVNCCRDFWKANRLRPAAVGGSDFGAHLDQLADPNHELSREWDREHDLFLTRKLLEQIREEFEPATWEAFERVTFKGEPAAQVAVELGMSPNAVFIAKSRILARLRDEAAGLID